LPEKLSQILALPLLVDSEERKNKRIKNLENLARKIKSRFGFTTSGL